MSSSSFIIKHQQSWSVRSRGFEPRDCFFFSFSLAIWTATAMISKYFFKGSAGILAENQKNRAYLLLWRHASSELLLRRDKVLWSSSQAVGRKHELIINHHQSSSVITSHHQSPFLCLLTRAAWRSDVMQPGHLDNKELSGLRWR
jgi:hypothetical protein